VKPDNVQRELAQRSAVRHAPASPSAASAGVGSPSPPPSACRPARRSLSQPAHRCKRCGGTPPTALSEHAAPRQFTSPISSECKTRTRRRSSATRSAAHREVLHFARELEVPLPHGPVLRPQFFVLAPERAPPTHTDNQSGTTQPWRLRRCQHTPQRIVCGRVDYGAVGRNALRDGCTACGPLRGEAGPCQRRQRRGSGHSGRTDAKRTHLAQIRSGAGPQTAPPQSA
jgi:hypothetical protein